MTSTGREDPPFHRRTPLHFDCTRCGACCSGGPDEHVFLADGEAERIAAYLGIGRDWFCRRYLARTEEGDLVLATEPGGACVLLCHDGTCRAYEARPVQCRTYPFWPEVLKTARTWRREARRCEGIGRGARVPLERIEAALREIGS